MNRGPRGNAYAFKLQSLLKIGDTKSSKLKDYTLLHYVVSIVDSEVGKIFSYSVAFICLHSNILDAI